MKDIEDGVEELHSKAFDPLRIRCRFNIGK